MRLAAAGGSVATMIIGTVSDGSSARTRSQTSAPSMSGRSGETRIASGSSFRVFATASAPDSAFATGNPAASKSTPRVVAVAFANRTTGDVFTTAADDESGRFAVPMVLWRSSNKHANAAKRKAPLRGTVLGRRVISGAATRGGWLSFTRHERRDFRRRRNRSAGGIGSPVAQQVAPGRAGAIHRHDARRARGAANRRLRGARAIWWRGAAALGRRGAELPGAGLGATAHRRGVGARARAPYQDGLP